MATVCLFLKMQGSRRFVSGQGAEPSLALIASSECDSHWVLHTKFGHKLTWIDITNNT